MARADIEVRRDVGTLMPEGLAAAMSIEQRRDLVRFLTGIGHEPAGGTRSPDERPRRAGQDSVHRDTAPSERAGRAGSNRSIAIGL